MLKDQNGGFVFLSKLDNTSTHLMRKVLISIAELAPKSFVILFAFGKDAGLMSVAGNTS